MPALLEYFEAQLGRSLQTIEVVALEHLSPQGVAKVNTDLHRDVPVATTLSELVAVYQAFTRWRPVLLNALSDEALAFVASLGRSVSLTELLVLVKMPVSALMDWARQSDEFSADFALEDAARILVTQAVAHEAAEHLSQHETKIQTSVLGPTGGSPQYSATALCGGHGPLGTQWIAANPVVAWFEHNPSLSAADFPRCADLPQKASRVRHSPLPGCRATTSRAKGGEPKRRPATAFATEDALYRTVRFMDEKQKQKSRPLKRLRKGPLPGISEVFRSITDRLPRVVFRKARSTLPVLATLPQHTA
eukprot:RCo050778